MRSLHVSLGHNSSACLAVDGVVTRGYEQERIDRKKSSSAYPRGAINLALAESPFIDVAYVSHWFDDFDIANFGSAGRPDCKYLDFEHLSENVGKVVSLTPEFTHHDAHAASAVSFAHGHGINGPAVVIVADGFGNLQECLSAYRLENGRLDRFHRSYGYANSLGLMYQYTTEALGLRPNQDEYKLLGYEAHVCEHLHRDFVMQAHAKVTDDGIRHAYRMLGSTTRPDPSSEGLIDLGSLSRAKGGWFDQVSAWHSTVQEREIQNPGAKSFVAFCAQTFLESAMIAAINALVPRGVRQIILAGGCFYNVKLTRQIMLATNCRVFAHPLCGDQGAALGMGDAPALLSLCVGERRIRWRTTAGERVGNVLFTHDDRWVDTVADLLSRDRIVNLVRGSMEYGPRALCNTSTLALPTLENVSRINRLNDRDDAMPMAPVMTDRSAKHLLGFDELAMMRGCEQYMIATMAWSQEPEQSLLGVCHRDPIDEKLWTSRPQVVTQHRDPQIYDLLSTTPSEMLINTSFNYHGEPIVMTVDDALRTHDAQVSRTKTVAWDGEPPVTVLVQS